MTPASAPFQPACAAADDPRALVREQDHAAIGAGDAERQAGGRGREGVAARAGVGRPGVRDCNGVGRMDLIGNGQPLGADADRGRDAGAVLRHRFRRVVRADAAVERGVDAHRHSAEPREEAMRDPGQPQRIGGEQWSAAHAGFAVAGWKPGGGRSLRSATAIALNKAPISP